MHDYTTSNYYSVPFAHVSQDGKYAAFTSNWGGTLGVDPQNMGDGKRIDLFLVELNQTHSVPAVDSIPPTLPVLPFGIDGSQGLPGSQMPQPSPPTTSASWRCDTLLIATGSLKLPRPRLRTYSTQPS
jgi:hypothetical protein